MSDRPPLPTRLQLLMEEVPDEMVAEYEAWLKALWEKVTRQAAKHIGFGALYGGLSRDEMVHFQPQDYQDMVQWAADYAPPADNTPLNAADRAELTQRIRDIIAQYGVGEQITGIRPTGRPIQPITGRSGGMEPIYHRHYIRRDTTREAPFHIESVTPRPMERPNSEILFMDFDYSQIEQRVLSSLGVDRNTLGVAQHDQQSIEQVRESTRQNADPAGRLTLEGGATLNQPEQRMPGSLGYNTGAEIEDATDPTIERALHTNIPEDLRQQIRDALQESAYHPYERRPEPGGEALEYTPETRIHLYRRDPSRQNPCGERIVTPVMPGWHPNGLQHTIHDEVEAPGPSQEEMPCSPEELQRMMEDLSEYLEHEYSDAGGASEDDPETP